MLLPRPCSLALRAQKFPKTSSAIDVIDETDAPAC